MPPGAKRRKISAATTHSSTAPAAQRSIQAFGKISKSQVRDPGKGALGKDSPVIHGQDASSKKRKLEPASTSADQKEYNQATGLSEQAPSIDSSSSRPGEGPIESPVSSSTQTRAPLKKPLFATNDVETPTKGARSYLQSLALTSSSPSISSSPVHTTPFQTPPSSPVSEESEFRLLHEAHQLPDELQDLVNLYSSFLTALSLHYAHNGSMTPADLRNLGPGIERAWRKRRVTTHDVRRILAIGRPEGAKRHDRAEPLYLSDYGHGKICVEITDHPGPRTATRRPLNEEVLNAIFLRNLEQRWVCYKTDKPPDPSPLDFVASLPLLPITPCTSLSKIAPLLSKGQRRLEDLKAGAIKAQQKALTVTSANPTTLPQPKSKQTSARSTDLFSRLKAKQLHQSTLPLPPSAEALARKSALQRLHEITPVLESLAFSSKKHANDDAAASSAGSIESPVSFTMPTLVQHLQMSLRNPIGKEEVIRCIKMAAEVAPEWVGLKEVGRVVAVTIRGAELKRDEIERKIESLLKKT